MKILLACEESQAVCLAFRALGHEAYSCDTQESSGGRPEWHIRGDVLAILNGGVFQTESGRVVEIYKWDMMIAFPPCTYLSYAGKRHWNAAGRAEKREAAMAFFIALWNAPIDRIVIENPLGYPVEVFRRPDQIIHPYYFGDEYQKRTCLWLKKVPALIHAKQDTLFEAKTHVPKPDAYAVAPSGRKANWVESAPGWGAARQKARSKTFPGIASAMANQWCNL